MDKSEDPLSGSRARSRMDKANVPLDDPLGGSGARSKTKKSEDPLDDPLGGSGARIRTKKPKDPMDDPLGGNDPLGGSGTRSKTKKSKDPMDDPPGGSGARSETNSRQCPPQDEIDDLDKSDLTLDSSENFANLIKKEPPKRTLSGELESSLRISDRNWNNLDTVHKHKFAFDESDASLMDDSFAGSSFASTTDSIADGEDYARRFTQLDEEKPKEGKAGPVRNTPRRTYSKQRKQMPKKYDPLSAISEDEGSGAEE